MHKPILRLSDSRHMPDHFKNGAVAIGNFDGVHRGHQAVLEQALDVARTKNLPSIVLTFEPHPRSYFDRNMPVDRLTPASLKADLLQRMGFDVVIEYPFNADCATMQADEFVQKILVSDLGAKSVIIGYDFHFGKNRQGTPQFLQQAGQDYGFDVIQIEAFRDEGHAIISSSRIREDLLKGDVAGAAALLGYHYTVQGVVEHGAKLGRQLGFPTANLALPPQTGLKYGIYAVRVTLQDQSVHNGIASFGRRPTVDDHGKPLLEVFLFDFNGDLYGQEISVSFYAFLREELKFDGLDPLVAQMQQDEQQARRFLQELETVLPLDRQNG